MTEIETAELWRLDVEFQRAARRYTWWAWWSRAGLAATVSLAALVFWWPWCALASLASVCLAQACSVRCSRDVALMAELWQAQLALLPSELLQAVCNDETLFEEVRLCAREVLRRRAG